MLTAQLPIESQFRRGLVDNLNAEARGVEGGEAGGEETVRGAPAQQRLGIARAPLTLQTLKP